MISLMTAREWLAVLSLPNAPFQQIALYIRYCKHVTSGRPPHEVELPVTTCSLSLLFGWLAFLFSALIISAQSCTHVWIKVLYNAMPALCGF